jgi:hypothetical protein
MEEGSPSWSVNDIRAEDVEIAVNCRLDDLGTIVVTAI